MKLSTHDLRTFAAIADLGGISAAARKLGMPKSSVSRDLASLEAQLGTRLVQRTTRHVSLTDAGSVLVPYARRVVEELDNALAAVESLQEAPRGHLSVTAPYALVRFVLAPGMTAFQSRYPDLRVSIDPTIRVLDLVDEGFDVAIRVGELPPSSLVARKLAEIPLILVASKQYTKKYGVPASPDALVNHCLIDLKSQAAETQWALTGIATKRGEQTTVNVSTKLAIAEPSILLDITEQGLGIATVPSLYAAKGIVAQSLVHVLPDYIRGTRPIHAVYPSRKLLTPKVRAFIEFVAESLDVWQKSPPSA